MNVRLSALARGRVQMVGYRLFTERAARRIGGLTGTVRNLPDGASVEVIAEGPRAQLEELLSELEMGPPHALVRSLDVSWSKAGGEFDQFETIY